MKSIKDILVSASAACIILTLNACIKDDRSDCPEEERSDYVQVYMSYTPICSLARDGESDEIEQIDLFIFDAQGKYVDRLTDSPASFDSDYFMDVSLDAGTYKFVAWGNLMGCYYLTPSTLVKGQTTIDEVMVHLYTASGEITDEPHILYFSDLDNVNVTSSGGSYRMQLNHNVHRINVVIENYYLLGEPLSLLVADTHGSFNFDNTAAYASNPFQYRASYRVEDNTTAVATITTMKLDYDRETWLRVYNEYRDEIIYEADVVELVNGLIGQGVNMDLSNTCILEFTMRFNANMTLDVYINGWKVVENGQEL